MKMLLLALLMTSALILTPAEISSRKKDLARQRFGGNDHDEDEGTLENIKIRTNEIIKEHKPLIWRLILGADNAGDTPFHLAALNGNIPVMDTILPYVIRHPGLLKAMIDAKNNEGKTALDLAEAAGHSAVVTKIRELMDSDHYKSD